MLQRNASDLIHASGGFMKAKISSLFSILIAAGTAGLSSPAHGASTCFHVQVNQMKSVAEELSLPSLICFDSLRVNGDKLEIVGSGVPAVATLKRSTFEGRTRGSVVLFDRLMGNEVCGRTARARINLYFPIEASGEVGSSIQINGMIYDTSDNCHLSGESEFIEFVRQ
ncbi:MAG: hypothetical protein RJB38_1400 [Pseudomonadota bacterium]|jgi:hypothetical protein